MSLLDTMFNRIAVSRIVNYCLYHPLDTDFFGRIKIDIIDDEG